VFGAVRVGSAGVTVDALDGGSGVVGAVSVAPGVPGVAGASCADFGPARNRVETWRQMKSAAKPKRMAATAAMPRNASGSLDERLEGTSAPNAGGGVDGDPSAGGCSGRSGGRPGGSGGAVAAGRDPVDGRAACAASVS